MNGRQTSKVTQSETFLFSTIYSETETHQKQMDMCSFKDYKGLWNWSKSNESWHILESQIAKIKPEWILGVISYLLWNWDSTNS